MKTRTVFVCSACGATTLQWQGRCATCGEWNSLTEERSVRAKSGRAKPPSPASAPRPLAEASGESHQSLSTGLPEMDAFLGRGMVPGGATLLGGEPGIGKSTLLLQLAGSVANAGGKAVYVTGEESLPQLKNRAERLGVLSDNLLALASNQSADAAEALGSGADLVVADSVQTMASAQADGPPGSVSQVRTVAAELIEAAKKSNAALMLVGHVTKDGQIAGPKLMEHMVDTVLSLEGDRRHAYRLLRVLKNRFGPTDELLVFEMRQAGLTLVPDPSTFFLGARDETLPGSAVVMAVDGTRPFAVEVQALVSKSYLSIPRRTALGFDAGRLHLLLAVMEKHLRISLGQFDVYAKIGAGLRLSDPGLDLGLAASILSSYFDRALPGGAMFWGEVDLSGRIRPCAGADTRRKQAKRLGYSPLYHAGGKKGLKTLSELASILFGKS